MHVYSCGMLRCTCSLICVQTGAVTGACAKSVLNSEVDHSAIVTAYEGLHTGGIATNYGERTSAARAVKDFARSTPNFASRGSGSIFSSLV